MTTDPAIAIRNEIRQLIDLHIEIFGQYAPLTPLELDECHSRTERIKKLGQELERTGSIAVFEQRFRKAFESIAFRAMTGRQVS